MAIKWRTIFPVGQNGEQLPSYQVPFECQARGSGDFTSAIAKCEALLLPTDPSQVKMWLAELELISAKRSQGESNSRLQLAAYTDRLRSYPVDVVHYALKTHTWKFFPTWHELKIVCDEKVGPRRAMLTALRRGPSNVEDRPPPTAEERQRIGDLVRGFTRTPPPEDQGEDNGTKG